MINAVLYCSYKGSPVGYQMSLADLSRETLTSVSSGTARIPQPIKNYFSHGGSNCVCGYDTLERMYFLLFKRMELEDDSKRFDEMGRKIFINISFFGSDPEEITRLTKGFFAQYNAVKKAFANLLLLKNNELGYEVDFTVLKKVVDSCIAMGKNVKCNDLFHILYSAGYSISFVSVEAGWDYFAQMCKISSGTKPMQIIEAPRMLSAINNTPNELFETQAYPAPKQKEEIIPKSQEDKQSSETSDEKNKQKRKPGTDETKIIQAEEIVFDKTTQAEKSVPDTSKQPEKSVTVPVNTEKSYEQKSGHPEYFKKEDFENWEEKYTNQSRRFQKDLNDAYAKARDAEQYCKKHNAGIQKTNSLVKIAILIASCAAVIAIAGLVIAIVK